MKLQLWRIFSCIRSGPKTSMFLGLFRHFLKSSNVSFFEYLISVESYDFFAVWAKLLLIPLLQLSIYVTLWVSIFECGEINTPKLDQSKRWLPIFTLSASSRFWCVKWKPLFTRILSVVNGVFFQREEVRSYLPRSLSLPWSSSSTQTRRETPWLKVYITFDTSGNFTFRDMLRNRVCPFWSLSPQRQICRVRLWDLPSSDPPFLERCFAIAGACRFLKQRKTSSFAS